MASLFQPGVNQFGQLSVLLRVGGVEVVEVDQKVREVGRVLGVDVGDQLFGGDAFLLGAQHDGRAMRVVSTDVYGLVTAQLLEANPNVGLNVLQHVPKVD